MITSVVYTKYFLFSIRSDEYYDGLGDLETSKVAPFLLSRFPFSVHFFLLMSKTGVFVKNP